MTSFFLQNSRENQEDLAPCPHNAPSAGQRSWRCQRGPCAGGQGVGGTLARLAAARAGGPRAGPPCRVSGRPRQRRAAPGPRARVSHVLKVPAACPSRCFLGEPAPQSCDVLSPTLRRRSGTHHARPARAHCPPPTPPSSSNRMDAFKPIYCAGRLPGAIAERCPAAPELPASRVPGPEAGSSRPSSAGRSSGPPPPPAPRPLVSC